MCCFSRPVDSVNDTKIFARAGGAAGQYVVYSMRMSADQDLAMILPIPVKQGSGEDAVRFISLEKYEDFFRDVDRGFPRPPTNRAKSEPSLGDVDSPKLAVVEVGSFEGLVRADDQGLLSLGRAVSVACRHVGQVACVQGLWLRGLQAEERQAEDSSHGIPVSKCLAGYSVLPDRSHPRWQSAFHRVVRSRLVLSSRRQCGLAVARLAGVTSVG